MLIAEHEGRPIGFIQIIDPKEEESRYWGNCEPNLRAIDIWIGESDCLGKGFGAQMMQLAFERCFANPAVTAIIIDPMADNVRAHRFYERLDFASSSAAASAPTIASSIGLERRDWRQGN